MAEEKEESQEIRHCPGIAEDPWPPLVLQRGPDVRVMALQIQRGQLRVSRRRKPVYGGVG